MFICPTPLAYALPAMPSSVIPDEEVIDAAPLNQGPPSTDGCAGQKREVKPQPEPGQQMKRQKIGVPQPKRQRPVASG
jgi:hypothetical protein